MVEVKRMSETEALAKQLLTTFVAKMDGFETAITRLTQTIEFMNSTQRDTVGELRELRREFAALAAKLEMAIGRH
jgi:ethanolamine utilization protein EutP (predicted NTPase)